MSFHARFLDSDFHVVATAIVDGTPECYSGSVNVQDMPTSMRHVFEEYEDLINIFQNKNRPHTSAPNDGPDQTSHTNGFLANNRRDYLPLRERHSESAPVARPIIPLD